MGNKNAKAEKMRHPDALNLVEFRRKISAGDLILIGQRKNIESDIAIPPQLLHSIEFSIKNKFSISHDIELQMWDSVALVVDMEITPNAGKSILELTNDGFVLSEFISRMTEIKKKGFDMCVRFLTGVKDNNFRENLLTLAEYLAGKSLDDLEGTPVYDEVYSKVFDFTNDPSRDSNIYSQLKEAFYMIVTNADNLEISKNELHDMMREFTGTNMDLNAEELADILDIQETVNFNEFRKKWAESIGHSVLSEEIFPSAYNAGQFAKYCYRTLGVIEEVSKCVSTPDDFATNQYDVNGLRNSNLNLINNYMFSVQTPVRL